MTMQNKIYITAPEMSEDVYKRQIGIYPRLKKADMSTLCLKRLWSSPALLLTP